MLFFSGRDKYTRLGNIIQVVATHFWVVEGANSYKFLYIALSFGHMTTVWACLSSQFAIKRLHSRGYGHHCCTVTVCYIALDGCAVMKARVEQKILSRAEIIVIATLKKTRALRRGSWTFSRREDGSNKVDATWVT